MSFRIGLLAFTCSIITFNNFKLQVHVCLYFYLLSMSTKYIIGSGSLDNYNTDLVYIYVGLWKPYLTLVLAHKLTLVVLSLHL